MGKSFDSLGKSLKQVMHNPYILLGCFILLTGLVLYGDCIFGDKILAYSDWGSDTMHSYLPIYESFVQDIVSGNVVVYDFSNGFGTAFAARMMLLFDPFVIIIAMLSAFFHLPIGFLLVYMQLFKAIVCGELCFVFLKQHHCSNQSSFLASYIFSYSGYMIATGQHYYFTVFPILTVFLLVAFERYLKTCKFFLLIFASALIGMVGPYLAFQTYLMIAVYVCIRVGLKNLRIGEKIALIAKSGLLMITGLLLSMYSLLMQANEILNVSARISDMTLMEKIKSGFFWLPFSYIKTAVLRLFSCNLEGTVNHWTGINVHFEAFPFTFSVLFVLCLGQFLFILMKKKLGMVKRIVIFGIIVTFIFSICNAFIPMLFNVFAGLQYRYVFVWLPFFALLVAYTLDSIYIEGNFSHIANFVTFIAAFAFVAFFVRSEEILVLIAKYTVLLSLSCCAILFSTGRHFMVLGKALKTRIIYGVLLAIVSVQLLLDNSITIYGGRAFMTKEGYSSSYWDKESTKLIDYVNETEGDNFVRMDRTFSGYGAPSVVFSALVPYRSVSLYNSTVNSNLVEFQRKCFSETAFFLTQMSYNLRSYGMIFDEIIAANLGIKYLISDKEHEIDGWSLVKDSDQRFLYKNDKLQSAGLLYYDSISESDYEKLDLPGQKTALSQVIVLEDEKADIVENSLEKTFYEKAENAIVQINDINGQALLWENDEITAGTYGDENFVEFRFDSQILNIANQQVFLHFNIDSDVDQTLTVIYNNGKEDILVDNSSRNLNITANQSQEVLIPVMQDTVMLRIQYSGNVSLRNIEVLCNCPISYSNEGISFSNKDMGSAVEGTVELDEKAFLYMPIVYENGWHAYVNGKEVELLKANYGFMAIELEKGVYDVVFKYQSPVLVYAIVLTCLGGVIVCALAIFVKIKRREGA